MEDKILEEDMQRARDLLNAVNIVFFCFMQQLHSVHFVIRHWVIKTHFVYLSIFVLFHSKFFLKEGEENEYLRTYYVPSHMVNTGNSKINEEGAFLQCYYESHD